MRDELKQLYEMIDDIEIGMMTTRRTDGHLESRAMASQKHAPGADLWFVTSEHTAKLRDLEGDPHVNLAFYNSKTREWVSVSGIARLSRDKRTIAALYAADWRIWFPDEGDPPTARLTIRASCSSGSTFTPPFTVKSTSRGRSSSTKWPKAG